MGTYYSALVILCITLLLFANIGAAKSNSYSLPISCPTEQATTKYPPFTRVFSSFTCEVGSCHPGNYLTLVLPQDQPVSYSSAEISLINEDNLLIFQSTVEIPPKEKDIRVPLESSTLNVIKGADVKVTILFRIQACPPPADKVITQLGITYTFLPSQSEPDIEESTIEVFQGDIPVYFDQGASLESYGSIDLNSPAHHPRYDGLHAIDPPVLSPSLFTIVTFPKEPTGITSISIATSGLSFFVVADEDIPDIRCQFNGRFYSMEAADEHRIEFLLDGDLHLQHSLTVECHGDFFKVYDTPSSAYLVSISVSVVTMDKKQIVVNAPYSWVERIPQMTSSLTFTYYTRMAHCSHVVDFRDNIYVSPSDTVSLRIYNAEVEPNTEVFFSTKRKRATTNTGLRSLRFKPTSPSYFAPEYIGFPERHPSDSAVYIIDYFFNITDASQVSIDRVQCEFIISSDGTRRKHEAVPVPTTYHSFVHSYSLSNLSNGMVDVKLENLMDRKNGKTTSSQTRLAMIQFERINYAINSLTLSLPLHQYFFGGKLDGCRINNKSIDPDDITFGSLSLPHSLPYDDGQDGSVVPVDDHDGKDHHSHRHNNHHHHPHNQHLRYRLGFTPSHPPHSPHDHSPYDHSSHSHSLHAPLLAGKRHSITVTNLRIGALESLTIECPDLFLALSTKTIKDFTKYKGTPQVLTITAQNEDIAGERYVYTTVVQPFYSNHSYSLKLLVVIAAITGVIILLVLLILFLRKICKARTAQRHAEAIDDTVDDDLFINDSFQRRGPTYDYHPVTQ